MHGEGLNIAKVLQHDLSPLPVQLPFDRVHRSIGWFREQQRITIMVLNYGLTFESHATRHDT